MSKENQTNSEEIKEICKDEKPESEDVKSLKNKLRKKETELKVLKKEKEELKDQYLRKLAEMENLQKRMEREKNEYYQYALNEFLKELLVVVDNLERAIGSKDKTDSQNLQEGIEMVYKQYLDLLMKKGIMPIEIKNKKFDPNLHQALITEESENVEETEIGEELQKGYSLHNRLLRPSLVKVIVPKKKKED